MFMSHPLKSSILVVDDESADRYSVQTALTRAGYHVVTASGYLRALEMVCDETRKIDLLLTDIVMPSGVNGFALARMARMRRQDLKILYMTAYDVPAGEALGDILHKPIADDDLVATVREALAA
jgi:CheY-like chemotaxis protein